MDPKPLWDKNVDNSRPLRKPKCMIANVTNAGFPVQPTEATKNTENAEIPDGSLTHNNLNFVTGTFDNMHIHKENKPSLNPDAPEWFPSYINVQQPFNNVDPPSSVQDRLKLRHKTQLEPQNSHKNDELGISTNPFINNDDFTDENYFQPDVKRLEHIITSLSKDPGQFDNLLDLFMETLIPYMGDFVALSVIVQVLVEQAINDANFRYSGAKLCWYVEQNCPEFRAELHLKCKKEVDSNSSLQNVVLFIAELYTQLPHLSVYGTLLVDSFKKLLTVGGNENIKCICQALKLTGYSLERSNKADLDEIMKQLENTPVSGSILCLLSSVIHLRQTNWGHTENVTENEEPEPVYYENLSPSITFQTDGNNLTNEENEFIAAHFQHGNDEFFSDMSDPDELCDPEPEMDEEIQAAFKEFLKFSSQK